MGSLGVAILGASRKNRFRMGVHLPDSLLQGVTLALGTGGLGGEEEETCEEGHCISKEGKGSYSKHHHLHQCQQSVTLPNWSPLSPSSPPPSTPSSLPISITKPTIPGTTITASFTHVMDKYPWRIQSWHRIALDSDHGSEQHRRHLSPWGAHSLVG